MSYEPTNWKDGDLVTSAKLNKIEQGIAAGGGVLVAHDEDGTLDKTWQEIYDADACIIQAFGDPNKYFELVTRAGIETQSSEGTKAISENSDLSQAFIIQTLTQRVYVASSPDDYPAFEKTSGGLPSGSDTPIVV